VGAGASWTRLKPSRTRSIHRPTVAANIQFSVINIQSPLDRKR
jgi:hypothetical protein